MVLSSASHSACQDRKESPDSYLTNLQTRPALEFPVTLPGLADLVDDPMATNGLLDRWAATWMMGAGTGRTARATLYAGVLPELLERMDRSSVAELRGPVETALTLAADLPDLPPHLALLVEEAQRNLVRAETEARGEDWPKAGEFVLLAADALREAEPRTVAATLVEVAELALQNPRPSWPLGAQDVQRATRLTRWARSALLTGDWERSITRGFYACIILGVMLP